MIELGSVLYATGSCIRISCSHMFGGKLWEADDGMMEHISETDEGRPIVCSSMKQLSSDSGLRKRKDW